MGLREDAKSRMDEILGEDASESVLQNFDDPKKYPQDFIEEVEFFLKKLIGDEPAQKKVAPLYIKYHLKPAIGRARAAPA